VHSCIRNKLFKLEKKSSARSFPSFSFEQKNTYTGPFESVVRSYERPASFRIRRAHNTCFRWGHRRDGGGLLPDTHNLAYVCMYAVSRRRPETRVSNAQDLYCYYCHTESYGSRGVGHARRGVRPTVSACGRPGKSARQKNRKYTTSDGRAKNGTRDVITYTCVRVVFGATTLPPRACRKTDR